MAKPARRWMPIDTDFIRDDKITDAGWDAAELYLGALGHLTNARSADGRITRQVVAKLGVSRWEVKANRLVKAGLWSEPDPDTYLVTAWYGWQQESESAQRTREWRARQRSQRDVT